MGKILITGASGFIGSFIVEAALNKGFDIWAGIRKSSSRVYLQDDRLQFIDLHFSDKEKLKTQLKEFQHTHGKWDYIIHNAGVTKCQDKNDFDKINFQFTRNFADALLECNMQPDKFILMSSLSAWGPVNEISMQPINLQETPCPNTEYGKSKLKAGQYIQSLSDFPYIILHPTGVYGPREKDYYLMFKSVKQGIDFIVGRKAQYITFIYVKDLVNAIFLAIEKNVTNKSYCVSDGYTYTATDFSELIQQKLRKKHVFRLMIPLPVVKIISIISEKLAMCFGKISTLNGDKYHIFKQRNWMCDISKLQQELDFKPAYDLEKGVEETISWYKKEKWL